LISALFFNLAKMSLRNIYNGSTFYTFPDIADAQDGDALTYDDATKSVKWGAGSGPSPVAGDVIGTANQVVVTKSGDDNIVSLAPVIELGVDGSAGQITLDSTAGLVSVDTLQVNTVKVGLISTGYTLPEVAGADGQYLGLIAPNQVGWLDGAEPGSGVVESIEAGLNIIVTGTASIPQIEVATAPVFTGLTLGDGATTYTFPAERASADNMSLLCNANGTMVFATVGGGAGSTIDSIVPVANETTASTTNNICTVGLADSVNITNNLAVGNVLTVGADVLATKYALPQTNGLEGQALVCHNNQTCTWETVGGSSGALDAVIGTAGQVVVDTVEGTAEVSLADALSVVTSVSIGTTTTLDSQTLRIATGTAAPYALPLTGPAIADNAYALKRDGSGNLTWADIADAGSINGTANQVTVSTSGPETTISLPPQIVIQSGSASLTVQDSADGSKVVVGKDTLSIWPTSSTFYSLPNDRPQPGQIMSAISQSQLGWTNGGASFADTALLNFNISFGQGSTNPGFVARLWSAGGYGKGGKIWCDAAQRFQWNGNDDWVMYSPPITYPNSSFIMSDYGNPTQIPEDQIVQTIEVSRYDLGGVFQQQFRCYLLMRYFSPTQFRFVIMIVDQNGGVPPFTALQMYSIGPNLDTTNLRGTWAQYSFTYA
jgi:hypothetical protein